MLKKYETEYETSLGEIRLYECPKCFAQWFEFLDADEYPEYCPHCGETAQEE